MDELKTSVNLNQNQQNNRTNSHRHHHHKKHSDKKSGSKGIYRSILIITGFTLIFFSVTEENILLALSGSILLLISILFTDVFKNLTKITREFFVSFSSSIDEGRKHSHRRHHKNH